MKKSNEKAELKCAENKKAKWKHRIRNAEYFNFNPKTLNLKVKSTKIVFKNTEENAEFKSFKETRKKWKCSVKS